MIESFGCPDAEALFHGIRVRRWQLIERVVLRKLAALHRAASLDDLRSPPGNRLKPLHGSRNGQHSIRVNDQFRICFVWYDSHAHDVTLVDYH